MPAIVPLLLNAVAPPMMSFERCVRWGQLIAQAITAYPHPLKVAILATGGLSHSIGEPAMGQINETFDRACLEKFAMATIVR